jgi:hypothetical protein
VISLETDYANAIASEHSFMPFPFLPITLHHLIRADHVRKNLTN